MCDSAPLHFILLPSHLIPTHPRPVKSLPELQPELGERSPQVSGISSRWTPSPADGGIHHPSPCSGELERVGCRGGDRGGQDEERLPPSRLAWPRLASPRLADTVGREGPDLAPPQHRAVSLRIHRIPSPPRFNARPFKNAAAAALRAPLLGNVVPVPPPPKTLLSHRLRWGRFQLLPWAKRDSACLWG